MDRTRFAPELWCLKELGAIGEQLAGEIPTYERLLHGKYDVWGVYRLARLMRQGRIDAMISVGAGDKMFWGRLAACLAGVPVIAVALHSTGWPDRIGRLNRLLTPITDAFIGVAERHGRYLIEEERFPPHKVFVIPNGVDTQRFRPLPPNPTLRAELGLPLRAPIAGTVARLRSEKNIELLLAAAQHIRQSNPCAHFLIVGDGPQRAELEALAVTLGLADCTRFVGARQDVPELLSLMDVFLLTSHVEANPVSILEAQACGKPVVATRVGSVSETVIDGELGCLVDPGDATAIAERTLNLFGDKRLATRVGFMARKNVITHSSLDRMVEGYQSLLEGLYDRKAGNHFRQAANVAAETTCATSCPSPS
jgi:glycosyltransferase involved in cell wall biosynthesis